MTRGLGRRLGLLRRGHTLRLQGGGTRTIAGATMSRRTWRGQTCIGLGLDVEQVMLGLHSVQCLGGNVLAETSDELVDALLQVVLLGLDSHDPLTKSEVLLLDGGLLTLQFLNLLALAFSRGLGGGAVAEDSLDAPLLLLVVCLGSLAF